MKFLPTIFLSFFFLFSSGCQAESQNIKQVDASEFKKIISVDTIQLLDVRTPDEFANGHISGAINMNVQSSDFRSKILGLKKNNPVAVYCRSGRRSMDAAKLLEKEGYVIYNLEGGIMDWEKNGYKTKQ